jgi:hypothetical protein
MSDYEQPTNVDDLPLFARSSDPETSHVSAPTLTDAAVQANQLLQAIRHLSEMCDYPTALEAGKYAARLHGGVGINIAKRLHLLKRLDPCPIELAGRRRCKVGKGTADTWRAVQ